MTGQSRLADKLLPPERIETEGLIIRRWTIHDIDARLHAITASLDYLRPWLPWSAQPQQLVDQTAFQLQSDDGWATGDSCNYGVFDDSSAELVAAIGLHNRIGGQAREIGYWVHAGHAGQGVMTRSVDRDPLRRGQHQECRHTPAPRLSADPH
jgi:ribosomal-protein-serine acetyltransferase